MEIDKKLDEINKEIEQIEQKIQTIQGEHRHRHATQQGTAIRKARIKKAVKVTNDDRDIGIIALWDDGKTTICITDEKGIKGGCYTTVDGKEKLFYIAQAWAASLSDKIKIKPIEVEEKGAKELIEKEKELFEKTKGGE